MDTEILATAMEIYKKGSSAQDIVEELKLPISVRQLQRIFKKLGVIRDVRTSLMMPKCINKKREGQRAAWAKHRETKKKVVKGVGVEQRYRILKRDGFRCKLCGMSAKDGAMLHVDHIKEKINGGTNDDSNLRTLCSFCNMGRGSVLTKGLYKSQ